MSEKVISQLKHDKEQLQKELLCANDRAERLKTENLELRDNTHRLKMEIFRIEQRLFGVKEIMIIVLGLIAGYCIGTKFV